VKRGCSTTLFVVGGWLLSAVGTVGLIPLEDDGVTSWALIATFAVIAAPILLLATWLSPGRRLAELGLTLMITAGAAAFAVAALAAIVFDPAMQRVMPELMPSMDFTKPEWIVIILLMAGGGFALWRWGRREAD
jgi:hypothetical protein